MPTRRQGDRQPSAEHWNVKPVERFTVNYARTPPSGQAPDHDYAPRWTRRLRDAVSRLHPG